MITKKLPNLVIAGINRGGTTSLFTYLSRHPEICASSIKETNYFMPVFYNEDLPPTDKYLDYFGHCNINTIYWMEASPRYLVGGEVIAKTIYERLGSIKVIFILRDPLKRLFSYYHQRKDVEFPKETSFEEYAERAIDGYNALKADKKSYDINVYSVDVYVRGLSEGFYIDYLVHWYKVFGRNIKICFFDNLAASPYIFMTDLCNWLDIDTKIYENTNFTIENKMKKNRSRYFFRLASFINKKFEKPFRRHHFFKKFLRDIYFLINESNQKSEGISETTSNKIIDIYRPYNLKLKHLLKSKGLTDLPDWMQ